MAFGRIKKEDLKEVGLDIDDLTAKLGGIPNDEKIKTIVQGSIQDTVNQGIKDLETRLTSQIAETIKQHVRPGNNNNNDGNNNNNNNNNNNEEEVTPIEFMDNPMEHSRRIAREESSRAHLATIQLASQMAYNEANRNLPYMKIAAIKEEVDAEWNKFPVAAKATPDILITNIYNMVVGRHLDEIQTDTNKREGKYNLIQSGGTTRLPNNQTSTEKPEDKLTDMERAAAKSFGMTDVEYAASKGGLKYA